ncbi:hypothetical protein MJT46_019064 [Ovis ammon polii x Ovis aries]|nr:hypothetical protein MJT46_019064 [Ovis ammon polii x Ovis aries]
MGFQSKADEVADEKVLALRELGKSRDSNEGSKTRGQTCKCPLLGKVWEADLEACRLLIQSLQLQEARGSLFADERQTDDLGGGTYTMALASPPRSHPEEERKTPLQAFEEWTVHLTPSPHSASSEQKEVSISLVSIPIPVNLTSFQRNLEKNVKP